MILEGVEPLLEGDLLVVDLASIEWLNVPIVAMGGVCEVGVLAPEPHEVLLVVEGDVLYLLHNDVVHVSSAGRGGQGAHIVVERATHPLQILHQRQNHQRVLLLRRKWDWGRWWGRCDRNRRWRWCWRRCRGRCRRRCWSLCSIG